MQLLRRGIFYFLFWARRARGRCDWFLWCLDDDGGFCGLGDGGGAEERVGRGLDFGVGFLDFGFVDKVLFDFYDWLGSVSEM